VYFDTQILKEGMIVEYDYSEGLNSCGVSYYLTKVTKTYVEGYSVIGNKFGDIKKITKPKQIKIIEQVSVVDDDEEESDDEAEDKQDMCCGCKSMFYWRSLNYSSDDKGTLYCDDCMPSDDESDNEEDDCCDEDCYDEDMCDKCSKGLKMPNKYGSCECVCKCGELFWECRYKCDM